MFQQKKNIKYFTFSKIIQIYFSFIESPSRAFDFEEQKMEY